MSPPPPPPPPPTNMEPRGTANLSLGVEAVFATLAIGCDGHQPRRSSRLASGSSLDATQEPPVLERVEMDGEGRVVYVDLQLTSDLGLDMAYVLQALRARLSTIQPTQRALQRMDLINRNRVLVEVDDAMALDLFRIWLIATVSSSGAMGEGLRKLFGPLGPHVLLIGGHFICPRVTEYEPFIQQQDPHTDVGKRGEVVGIGLNVGGEPMNTLIDPHATLDAKDEVQGGSGFRRANTPVFAFETAAVHAGPGVAQVGGPYPRFLTNRVFFLLCAANLDPAQVAEHRSDNHLVGTANLVISIPATPTS